MGCLESKQIAPEAVTLGRTARRGRLSGIFDEKEIHGKGDAGRTGLHITDEDELPELDANGRLVWEEVERRRTFTEMNTTHFKIGAGKMMRVRYASYTQRGYYPDDPFKENQDAISITQAFAGEDGDLFFGVYDGHGSEGHECASYAREHLPKLLSKYLRQERATLYNKQRRNDRELGCVKPYDPKLFPVLDAESYEKASHKAHLECNRNMIRDTLKIKLSGTTAISAGFHNGQFTISNVGDSRAVLGYRESNTDDPGEEKKEPQDQTSHQQHQSTAQGKLIALPLSFDQTPWRKDERNRIKAAGGRVLTVDQVEGRKPIIPQGSPDEGVDDDEFGDRILGTNDDTVDIAGDPPRVWLPDQAMPGTAYSRSLGDDVAQTVGVFAEPETCTKDFTRMITSYGDEVLVLASDGVFEFLTNQDVVDICDRVWNDGGCVIDACREIIDQSYGKWIEYENRTDDISVIVIRMDDIS